MSEENKRWYRVTLSLSTKTWSKSADDAVREAIAILDLPRETVGEAVEDDV